MYKYVCECCQFYTNHKTKFSKHIETTKHKKSTKVNILVNKSQHFSQQKVNKKDQKRPKKTKKDQKKDQNEEKKDNMILAVNDDIKNTTCKYCEKRFTTKQGMYRHIKYYCKKNDDEDLKELVRLLNEQNKQLKEHMNSEMDKRDKQIDVLNRKISKLSTKLQINNTNNGIINNNIILNNYKDTDISHLTDNDFKCLLKEINHCVPKMIEKVHFNPSVPENMNVYISNMKDKFIMVYKDGSWKLCDRTIEVDKMFDTKFSQLEEWLDSNNQYTELKRYFEKLEKNMEDKETEKYIKNEMKLIMYNNRGMLQDVKEDIEIEEEIEE